MYIYLFMWLRKHTKTMGEQEKFVKALLAALNNEEVITQFKSVIAA